MTDKTPPFDNDEKPAADKSQNDRPPLEVVSLSEPANQEATPSAQSPLPDLDDLDNVGANDEALAIVLSQLEEEHRDLDAAILALSLNTPREQMTIARLKKKKLALKDKIQIIKDKMHPDIIA